MERQSDDTNRVSEIEEFLTGLQQSWEEITKLIEEAQKNMKRQFNKKKGNP